MKSNKKVEINFSALMTFFYFIPRDYLLAELPIYSVHQNDFYDLVLHINLIYLWF